MRFNSFLNMSRNIQIFRSNAIEKLRLKLEKNNWDLELNMQEKIKNNYFLFFQDTPLSCEPTLLPEPNHVMLNHLYALSIKDGVMVLSTTQRFKRKYITTLLYKPMGTRTCEISI